MGPGSAVGASVGVCVAREVCVGVGPAAGGDVGPFVSWGEGVATWRAAGVGVAGGDGVGVGVGWLQAATRRTATTSHGTMRPA